MISKIKLLIVIMLISYTLSLAQKTVILTPSKLNHNANTASKTLSETLSLNDTLTYNKPAKDFRASFTAEGEDIIAVWFVCPQDLKIKSIGIDCLENNFGIGAEVKLAKLNNEWTEEKLKQAGSQNLGYWIANNNPSIIKPYQSDVAFPYKWVTNSTGATNPFGVDLWSDNGLGAPIILQSDVNNSTYQWIAMSILNNEPLLKKGEAFAVCIKNSGLKENENTFGIASTNQTGYGVFKFYANGRTKGDLTTAGWWKRDYLVNVAVAVEITGDISPTISELDILSTTLSKDARTVTAKIVDQNPSGGTTGVGNAYLQYFLNKDTTWKEIAMAKSIGDSYTGNLPGQQAGTKVTYRAKAVDVNGNTSFSSELYSYYVFEPTPGVKSLLVLNGMVPEGINQFPMNSYFVLEEPGKVNKWTHDVWAYGALISELVNYYTNIFEICSSDNSGENIKYNEEVIRTWLAQNGNRNYALAGQEWLGARYGFIDKNFSVGSFEYDILGITHSYNDVTDLSTSVKPSRMTAVQNSLLADDLYKKFLSWGSDSLQYDPYYELDKTENWIDGFDVVSGQQVDMQVETRIVNGTTQKTNLACLTHRTLSNGNKIAFFSYDPIAINTKSPKTNAKYFRFGTTIQAPQVKVLQWFNLITGIEETAAKIPTECKLYQNYPNPFNPETTISYKIQAASQVSLIVYDVLGREVATLVDEYKQAGTYNSKFSIINYKLVSGVYYYQMRAGNFAESKKFVFMK